MRKKKLRPPVKIHGGKFYLSNWILGFFPKNYEEIVYLEPFCGAGSVFFNKERSIEETLNDIDKGIVSILWALRDEPREFIGRLKRTKYTRGTFDRALKKLQDGPRDYLDQATADFIVRRMSRGGLKKDFAWSNRQRGGQPGDVNAWETMIEQLPLLAERLRGVYILHKSAFEVISAYNDRNTLMYVDPPYLASTRSVNQAYEYELTEDEHIELAKILLNFRGKVIISGYASPLYRELFSDWTCKRKRMPNHSGQTRKKNLRTECIWVNF
jgi:DNA adenine methylase